MGTQSICAGQINYYVRAGIDLKSVPSIVLSMEQLTALNGMLVDFFLDQHEEHCNTSLVDSSRVKDRTDSCVH